MKRNGTNLRSFSLLVAGIVVLNQCVFADGVEIRCPQDANFTWSQADLHPTYTLWRGTIKTDLNQTWALIREAVAGQDPNNRPTITPSRTALLPIPNAPGANYLVCYYNGRGLVPNNVPFTKLDPRSLGYRDCTTALPQDGYQFSCQKS